MVRYNIFCILLLLVGCSRHQLFINQPLSKFGIPKSQEQFGEERAKRFLKECKENPNLKFCNHLSKNTPYAIMSTMRDEEDKNILFIFIAPLDGNLSGTAMIILKREFTGWSIKEVWSPNWGPSSYPMPIKPDASRASGSFIYPHSVFPIVL